MTWNIWSKSNYDCIKILSALKTRFFAASKLLSSFGFIFRSGGLAERLVICQTRSLRRGFRRVEWRAGHAQAGAGSTTGCFNGWRDVWMVEKPSRRPQWPGSSPRTAHSEGFWPILGHKACSLQMSLISWWISSSRLPGRLKFCHQPRKWTWRMQQVNVNMTHPNSWNYYYYRYPHCKIPEQWLHPTIEPLQDKSQWNIANDPFKPCEMRWFLRWSELEHANLRTRRFHKSTRMF